MRDGQKDLNSSIEQCGPWSLNHLNLLSIPTITKKMKNSFFGIISTICNLFGEQLEKYHVEEKSESE